MRDVGVESASSLDERLGSVARFSRICAILLIYVAVIASPGCSPEGAEIDETEPFGNTDEHELYLAEPIQPIPLAIELDAGKVPRLASPRAASAGLHPGRRG